MNYFSKPLLITTLLGTLTMFGGGDAGAGPADAPASGALAEENECDICIQASSERNPVKQLPCCTAKMCQECFAKIPFTIDPNVPLHRQYKKCHLCQQNLMFSRTQTIERQSAIGQLYFWDDKQKQAIPYLKHAVNQSLDLSTKARAQALLGDIFFNRPLSKLVL